MDGWMDGWMDGRWIDKQSDEERQKRWKLILFMNIHIMQRKNQNHIEICWEGVDIAFCGMHSSPG